MGSESHYLNPIDAACRRCGQPQSQCEVCLETLCPHCDDLRAGCEGCDGRCQTIWPPGKDPTDKQEQVVQQIIDYLGRERVLDYFHHYFPGRDWDTRRRHEVQKVITGLGIYLPQRPVSGIGPWTISRAYWRDDP